LVELVSRKPQAEEEPRAPARERAKQEGLQLSARRARAQEFWEEPQERVAARPAWQQEAQPPRDEEQPVAESWGRAFRLAAEPWESQPRGAAQPAAQLESAQPRLPCAG